MSSLYSWQNVPTASGSTTSSAASSYQTPPQLQWAARATTQQHHHPHHHPSSVVVHQRQPPMPSSPGGRDVLLGPSNALDGVIGDNDQQQRQHEQQQQQVDRTSDRRTAREGIIDGEEDDDDGGEEEEEEEEEEDGEEDDDAAGGGGENDENNKNSKNKSGTNNSSNNNRQTQGKRLTTMEEVTLFEICNRHAETFGRRSRLCGWWMKVADEFADSLGHPYSWHSVRRKVEVMTRQRVKFLNEHRDRQVQVSSNNGTDVTTLPDDFSNPQWRAAIDAWIPTWQQWEDAEARRIEKRDSRRSRKRKQPVDGWGPLDSSNGSTNGRLAPSARAAAAAAAAAKSTPSGLLSQSPLQHAQTPSQNNNNNSNTTTAARLPPGFDSLFTNNNPQYNKNNNSLNFTPTAATPTATGTATGPALSSTTSPNYPDPNATASMVNGVLETLGKMNRYLDSQQSTTNRSSPIVSTVTPSPAESRNRRVGLEEREGGEVGDGEYQSSQHHQQDQSSTAAIEQLRLEFKRGIENDRAAIEERLDSVQKTQEMILNMLRRSGLWGGLG